MIKEFLSNIFHSLLRLIPYVNRLELDRIKLALVVERLENDLQKALVGDLDIVSMNMKNGKLDIAFKTKVTEALAKFGNSILEEADAKNYVEISFGFAPDRAVGSILIRKHNGRSPHELRLEAEAERDAAIAERDKAIAEKADLEYFINQSINA